MEKTEQTDPKAAGGVRKGEFGKFQQTGKRMLLVLFLLMLLSCMFGGIWPAVWFTQYSGTWAISPLDWTLVIILDILLFGLGYLATLLLWRIIIPPPKEGFYRFRKDGKPTREIVIFMLNIQLTRLRYGTPWSSTLIHTLSHLPVINGIYRRLFCPNMHMVTMGDSNVMVDPYLMHIHPTVIFGFFLAEAKVIFTLIIPTPFWSRPFGGIKKNCRVKTSHLPIHPLYFQSSYGYDLLT